MFPRFVRIAILGLAVAVVGLSGCKATKSNAMSKEDVQKFQQGPPKDMPAEGKALMNQAKSQTAPKGPAGPGK